MLRILGIAILAFVCAALIFFGDNVYEWCNVIFRTHYRVLFFMNFPQLVDGKTVRILIYYYTGDVMGFLVFTVVGLKAGAGPWTVDSGDNSVEAGDKPNTDE